MSDKCLSCGAPVTGDTCEYCGHVFKERSSDSTFDPMWYIRLQDAQKKEAYEFRSLVLAIIAIIFGLFGSLVAWLIYLLE